MIHIENWKGFKEDGAISLSKFPNGETKVQINCHLLSDSDYTIVVDFENNGDIVNLCLLKDALDRLRLNSRFGLRIPFFPYQQQDRVCNFGEPLSVKVIANIINGLNFNSVEVWDTHSDVTPALLNNCLNRSMESLIDFEPEFADLRSKIEQFLLQNYVVVAPDQGSVKKAYNFSKTFGFDCIHATKHRNTETGFITGTTLNSGGLDLSNKNFLIVDDMCVGGATFINLSKVIREKYNAKICLLTTHGLYSRGLEVFEGIIDEVICLNNMQKIDGCLCGL
jgi:ribose-phosphate pyrophosphokinase